MEKPCQLQDILPTFLLKQDSIDCRRVPNILANLLHKFLEQRDYTSSQEMVKHLQIFFFLSYSEAFPHCIQCLYQNRGFNLSKLKLKDKIPDSFLIVYRVEYLMYVASGKQKQLKLFSTFQPQDCRKHRDVVHHDVRKLPVF